MGELNLDFGDGVQTTSVSEATPSTSAPDITGSTAKPGDADITNKDNNTVSDPASQQVDNNDNKNGNDTDSSTGGLEAGTIIEFEGKSYTVAENGDIVDDKGEVFKAAADVQAWLDENEQTDDNTLDGATVEDIISSVGVDVLDENGNKIEFTNDKEGLKAYIHAVADLKSEETRQATLNKFYQDNPVVKQFVDYITVNGGSPVGFGDIPDRSGITVDKDNEIQQEQIIRAAAAEFGNKGVTDAYIKYLKDSGALYDEAVNQLNALQEHDEDVRDNIERNAEVARQAEADAVNEYWNKVNDVINSREIAGYKIPESFTKEVNGQKLTFTPDDFFDYLYKAKEVDANGNKVTGYQRDLNKLSDEEYLNKELLDAWLMFTGGTYKDLVDMAIKEREVHKLIVKSKQQRNSRVIRVNKPSDKGNVSDIMFE